MQYDEYGEPIGKGADGRVIIVQQRQAQHSGFRNWSGADYDDYYVPRSYQQSHMIYAEDQYPVEGEDQYYEQAEEYDAPRYVESNATEQGFLDEHKHLQVEQLDGVQERVIDATISGSLEEFQKHPHMTVWRPTPKMLENLKLNTRMVDRQNASEKDRKGNLKQLIPLKAKVISTYNSSAKKVAFDFPGLEGNVMLKNKMVLWTADPESKHVTVNEEAGSPNNIFTARMLEKQEKCDLNTLDEQIVFKSKIPNCAQADVNGFAWDIIMKNATRNPDWEQHAPLLCEIDEKKHMGELHSSMVDIPEVIARDVYSAIREQLIPIEKSYVDANQLQIKIETADGSAWNDPTSLIGNSELYDEESRLALRAEELQKKHTISIKLRLWYIVRGGPQN